MRPIKRVMLIYPPVTFSARDIKSAHLPLGLAYIAAVLRDHVEINILDASIEGYDNEIKIRENLLRYGLSYKKIANRIRKFQPDLVGVSCMYSNLFQNVASVVRTAKEVDPEIQTIIGGAHPTFMFDQCMERCPELDMISRGEGEYIFLDVVKASRNGGALDKIPGLVWRDESNVRNNQSRPPIMNLDELPFPARDLFPIKKYQDVGIPSGNVYKRKPFMIMITSRGCPYLCTFCSSPIFWKKFRTRSPENVLDEMEHLVNDFGIREIQFFDDNLTCDRKRAKELFKGMIERKINVTWNTPNGIHCEHLDEEMLDLMKESGCFEVTIAIESGDKDILKKIKKPTRHSQIEWAAKEIRKRGMESNGFFIIGFPWETKEQIQRTLDYAKKIDLDRISISIFNPLPGTALFDECVEKGYLKDPEVIENMDYSEACIETPEWTKEEVSKMRDDWFWQYNFGVMVRRPIRFVKNYLFLLFNPRMVKEILRCFLNVKKRAPSRKQITVEIENG